MPRLTFQAHCCFHPAMRARLTHSIHFHGTHGYGRVQTATAPRSIRKAINVIIIISIITISIYIIVIIIIIAIAIAIVILILLVALFFFLLLLLLLLLVLLAGHRAEPAQQRRGAVPRRQRIYIYIYIYIIPTLD